MNNIGRIRLHFEGDLVTNHQVTARTLAKALTHTQNAIDRAFLANKHGNLWKYARMQGADYETADFILMYPEPGGFVQDLKSNFGKQLVNRISTAIRPAFEQITAEGFEVAHDLSNQVENKKIQIENGSIQPQEFQNLVNNPGAQIVRAYSDRCINREIDQTLAIIRSPHAGDSQLEISIQGDNTQDFIFDKHKSQNFHSLVSSREIGQPVIYNVRVRLLDRDSRKGKVVNLENDKTINLNFKNDEDFLKAHPFLANNEPMTFIGAPIIEYGAFDPNSGDIYFLTLV